MKFYWTMPKGLQIYYEEELLKYRIELAAGNLSVAWQHLERAHIIGQSWPKEHNYVHWLMLKFGIYIKNTKEIIGRIPVGNTGGANVPPLKSMEIPEDLAMLLKKFKGN